MSESTEVRLARLEETTKTLRKDVDTMDKVFVRADVFNPVKAIVFGMAAIILTSVAGAIISQVISK